MRSCWRSQHEHSMVHWHLKQIGKVKKLNKWVPRGLTTNKINCFFQVSFSLILCKTNEPISIGLWCATKSGFYKTTGYNQLSWRRSSKALPKAKLVSKKVVVTVCWSAADLIHCSFLNPGETIATENYAQQLMRCAENGNACSGICQ